MGRSSEADGSADGAFNGTSAVCLREATTATEVQLHEGEVVNGHCTVRRVHLQRREKLLAENPFAVEIVRFRYDFGEVGEERQLRVWCLVAVFERDVHAVHLNTTRLVRCKSPGLTRSYHDISLSAAAADRPARRIASHALCCTRECAV